MDLDSLVTDALDEGEDNTALLLVELEAGLIEVGLDVVELRVVFIFVLNLLLEGLVQLLDCLLNIGSVNGEPADGD